MYRSTRHSVRDEHMTEISKGEIIKKLQNQSHNLSLDLESLKVCQKNLPFDKETRETEKFKLNSLLDTMISRIQDELEDIIGMINQIHHSRDVSEDLLKEIDLCNLRYSKLALQTEKVFVSTPLFMELRSKGNSAYNTHEETRNYSERKVDRSMREFHGESPHRHHHHDKVNKSFTTDVDNRPYMKDTFNSKVQKDLSHRRLESIDKSKVPRSIRKSPKSRSAFNDLDPEWIDDLLKQFSHEDEVNKHQKLTLHNKSVSIAQKSIVRESPSARQNIPKSSPSVKKTSFDFPPSTDVIKRELQSLRNFYNELKEKLDSHTHAEYDKELEKLKFENAKVLADNKVIQKDNSEVMHTLFNMKKEIKELREENQKLKKDMAKLKSTQASGSDHAVQSVYTSQTMPTQSEEVKPQPKATHKGRTSERSEKNTSARFLIEPKNKKKVDESEELVASWVKHRLDH